MELAPSLASKWAAEWLCVGCSALRFPSVSPVFDFAHHGGGCCSFPTLVLVFEMPALFGGPCCSVWSLPVLRVNQWHFQRHHEISPPRGTIEGRLYGRDPPITTPGSGTQSWLPCPLISLALAGVECAHGVPLHPAGTRQPAPPEKRFWLSFCSGHY